MLIFFLLLFQTLDFENLKNLKEGDQNKILQALDYFSFHPKEKALEDILALTRHDSFQIRANAIWCLSNFKDKTISERIAEFLKDESPYVKAYAILALIKLKAEEQFENVKDLINDPSSMVRLSAKAFYNYFGKGSFKEEIKNFLLSRNLDESTVSAMALSLFGDGDSIKLLMEILSHSMDEYRNVSAVSLKEAPYSQELLKKLFAAWDKESYFYVQNSLAKTLAYHGLKDIPYFTELLLNSKNSGAIIKQLITYEDSYKVLEEVSKGLKEINLSNAISILENFDNEDSLKIIRKIAQNNKFSGENRANAIKVLGRKRDSESLNFLRKMLKEKDPYLKASSSYALGLLKDEKSKDLILKLLKDETPRVRKAALFYIREMGLKETVKNVEELLDDKDSSVRQMAKQTLQKLKEN